MPADSERETVARLTVETGVEAIGVPVSPSNRKVEVHTGQV